jgi:hypothetical protein
MLSYRKLGPCLLAWQLDTAVPHLEWGPEILLCLLLLSSTTRTEQLSSAIFKLSKESRKWTVR